MKKRIKLTKAGRNFIALTFLFILDLIFVFNAPLILREVNTINDYRLNMLIYTVLFMFNATAILKMSTK